MKYAFKATTRVLSLILVVTLMFTAFPASAYATIDEPLNGVTGSGWDDFGGSPDGDETGNPPVTLDSLDEDGSDDGASSDGEDVDTVNDGGDPDTASIEGKGETATATSAALGTSGPVLDLPPEVEAEFVAFLQAVGNIIESKPSIMPFSFPGDTGTVSWVWGDPVGYTTTAGHYIGNIPRLTVSTSSSSLDIPFCARFGIDPNTSATYTAELGSNQQVLKLLIAHYEGKASAVGVQMALWSITNHASG